MKIVTPPYYEQAPQWPSSGRHIMAHFDDASIIVYQAYRPAIADFAVTNQSFGGEFSYSRMSWIKPNFLWMMFRSGWAQKEGQERILAVRIRRAFFDEILEKAVPSTFAGSGFPDNESWQLAVAQSDVRLQWDPDHDPAGTPLQRRAIQLGLRGDFLRRYGKSELLFIEDITSFVQTQRCFLTDLGRLEMPRELPYIPASALAASNIGLDFPHTAPATPPQRGETPKPGASDAGAQPLVTTPETRKP